MGPIVAVALSAVVAGSFDILATALLVRSQGVPFHRMLQFIASGLVGAAAFEGGAGTAALGFALHYGIAAIWALLYFAVSIHWPVVARPLLLSGIYCGVVVHLVMSGIVLPLSRVKRPFSGKAWSIQLAIHIVCVGLPIAAVQALRAH